MNYKIGLFSFFSGAGFLDLGFEKSGYEILFANEFHKSFMEIYKYSRQKMRIANPVYGNDIGDISRILENKRLNILKQQIKEARKNNDIIGFIGGPPCPDFSIGGKNRGIAGENGKLSGTYIDLICKVKPDFFLFENVKGLYRTFKHRTFFNNIKLKLIRNGYRLTEKLINSLEYGVPQDRERIILIGFRTDFLKELGKDEGQTVLKNFNWDKNVIYNIDEVKKYNWPTTDIFNEDNELPPPSNIPIELTVQNWFIKNKVNEHVNNNKYFQPRAGLPKFLVIREGDDTYKSFKRLHRWRYSPTAAYGNNEVHLHPYKARRLSAAEALAIQTLPIHFEIPEYITLSDTFKSIGNGVPFLAAKGLANCIKYYLK